MNQPCANKFCGTFIAMLIMGIVTCVAHATEPTPSETLATIAELRQGTLSRLVVHNEPQVIAEHELRNANDEIVTLGNYMGRILVVNFWATWCVPCRKEMPALDRLQQELGGDAFSVLTINIERNGLEKSRSFFEEHGITALKIYADPGSKFSTAQRVLGLPATLIVDPAGYEIGRLTGEAEWDAPEAIQFFEDLLALVNPPE